MEHWERSILRETDTMQKSIEVLDKEALRIVMVVDGDKSLIGTITDGDIRRALIKRLPLNTKLYEFMHKNPIVARKEDSDKSILSIIRRLDLLQIPIVDNNRKIIGLKTVQNLLQDKKYDNPVFLMAGGFGTRLRPLTEKKPKPLLNVGSRPILETIIGQFIDAGFCNFYISTHYKAEMIWEYFGDGSKWGINIKYLHESEPLGTAGALGLLPDNMPELPIVVMNGDLLTKVNFEHLLDFHHDQGGTATMCIREYDIQVPYGVVDIGEQYLTGIVEKPIHKFFVNAGIYVLEKGLINRINSDSYLDMPNFFDAQIKQGEQISVFPIHEYWLDIGRIEEYEKANKEAMDIL
jgi:dTDP-glucose pyrophosphorylase